MTKFDGEIKPLIHAHRGYSSIAPENTMSAFKMAMDIDADAIEIDIQCTKDGVVIISHDDTIDRCSNAHGFIKDMTLKELQNYDFGNPNVFGEKYKGEKLPTFEELIKLLKNRTDWDGFLNIEFKTADECVDKAIKLIKDSNISDRVMFCSFHLDALKRAKTLAPEIRCGFLVCEVEDINADALKMLRNNRIEYLHPFYEFVTPKFIRLCEEYNIKLNVWTVDDKAAIKQQVDLKVNGIISNTPEDALRIRNMN